MLPSFYKREPLFIYLEITPVEIYRGCLWRFRSIQEFQVCLGSGTATFLMIAVRTGRHEVIPRVRPAQVPGSNVVDGQMA